MDRLPKRYITTAILAVIGTALAWLAFQNQQTAVAEQLTGFPESRGSGHLARPWLLASLFILPFVTALGYLSSSKLDQYITRHFLMAFGLCLSSLLMIWVLIDLQDNLSDFQSSKSPLKSIGTFYLSQIPVITIIILPNTLLFSLLYVLGKMSSSKEIVAIIQTGRSVPRLVFPLLLVGLVCSLVCVIFNYHWAPTAEGMKKRILDRVAGRQESKAEKVIYFSTEGQRLWKVGRFPADLSSGDPLQDVSVTVKRDDGAIDYRLIAKRAYWSLEDQTWSFEEPTMIRNELPAPLDIAPLPEPVVTSWKETPWQIIQPGLKELHLGIPGLNTWLKENENSQWIDRRPYITQWNYRWAQPFICVVTVILAAPLGIVFSRRGTIGGVALAVGLSAGMLLSSNVFLALGEAGYLPPIIAAWTTNIIFSIVALVLFQRRITGRPIYQTFRKCFAFGS